MGRYGNVGFALNGLFSLAFSCITLPCRTIYNLFFPLPLDQTDLRYHIAIVTGGNTGIGKHTALNLVRRGCTVIIACRDPSRAAQAVKDIERESEVSSSQQYPYRSFGKIDCMILNLASLSSIDEFSRQFQDRFSHLDFLVNNGGLNTRGILKIGNDDIQQLFGVNYLGHFYLFRRLEHLLQVPNPQLSASPSRVVNLSSVTHHQGSSDYVNSCYFQCKLSGRYCGVSPYADSKLYLNYLTLEINRRYQSSLSFPIPQSKMKLNHKKREIISISVNPGAVQSDIWRSVPPVIRAQYDLFMSIFYLNTAQGSHTSLTGCILPLNEIKNHSKETQLSYHDQSYEGLLLGHPLIPYLVPYFMFWRCLAFEMIGPFAGSQWGYTSLPAGSESLSKDLWRFSCDLINRALVSERSQCPLLKSD